MHLSERAITPRRQESSRAAEYVACASAKRSASNCATKAEDSTEYSGSPRRRRLFRKSTGAAFSMALPLHEASTTEAAAPSSSVLRLNRRSADRSLCGAVGIKHELGIVSGVRRTRAHCRLPWPPVHFTQTERRFDRAVAAVVPPVTSASSTRRWEHSVWPASVSLARRHRSS